MTIEVLAALEAVLLIAGAAAAAPAARAMSRDANLSVKMMASVASWSILFGMIPFFAFAVFASGAPATDRVGGATTAVLNVIPFALAGSPVIGLVHGYVAGRRAEQ